MFLATYIVLEVKRKVLLLTIVKPFFLFTSFLRGLLYHEEAKEVSDRRIEGTICR